MSLCVGFDETNYHLDIISYFKNVDYIKINLAFHKWEKIKLINYIAQRNNIKVILDCKIGDIENTQKAYLKKYKHFDGLTINPYMGYDVVKPFLNSHLECFVLLITSNPTRGDFQSLIYKQVLNRIIYWHKENPKIGIVLGATIGEELFNEVIQILFDRLKYLPKILIPGIGTQGGNIVSILENVKKITGGKFLNNLIFSNSSGIMKSKCPLEKIKEMHLNIKKV